MDNIIVTPKVLEVYTRDVGRSAGLIDYTAMYSLDLAQGEIEGGYRQCSESIAHRN